MLKNFARPLTILSLTSLMSYPSLAASDIGVSPDRGYTISITTPNGVAQKSGQSAKVSGRVSLVGNPHEEEHASNLSALMAQDGVSVRAFFPDLTQEVTSSLVLSAADHALQFNFNTPNLDRTDLNTFSIQVSRLSQSSRDIQKIQSKLEKRIQALSLLIQKLTAQRTKKSDLAELQAFRDRLQSLLTRLGTHLSKKIEVLAEARFPLQVDNLQSQPSLNTTVMGKFLFSLSFNVGSAIQGQSVLAHGEILNLRGESERGDQSSSMRLAQFFWKGIKVKEFAPASIPNGQSLSFDYPTPKLSPQDQNLFSVNLFNYSKDGDDSGDRDSKDPKGIGSLSLLEPVAVDGQSPVWASGSTPDGTHSYVKNMETVSAQVQDLFGTIDPASIRATLNGSLAEGSSSNDEVTSRLVVFSSDLGQSFQISGDLNPLPEGIYSFSLTAKDVAGNSATPDPLKKIFRVDRTAPRLTLSQSGRIYSSTPNSNFQVAVEDLSPTTTRILKDGIEVLQSTASQVQVSVPLTEGHHAFRISSQDAAGNTVAPEPEFEIVTDTVKPVITLAALDNQLVKETAFLLPISVMDASPVVTTVFQNGTQIASSIQPSFTVTVSLTEGTNTFEIKSVDAAGNAAVSATLNSITLDRTPPVITLGANDHQIFRNSSFSLPVTVVDASTVTTQVMQNGMLVLQSSFASFSVSALLQEGLNVFEVTSVDAAGNSARQSLFDIVLDSTQPVLSNLNPVSGTILSSLSIPVSGSSSEALSAASVNGQNLLLSQDKKSFSGLYLAQTEGNLTLNWEASDLAGNRAVSTSQVQIVLKILNGDLISASPDADGTHLAIRGAPGATRSGLTVSANGGFFNSGSAVAQADGSFLIKLFPFSSARLSATDSLTGKSESVTVTFSSSGGTLLSGSVRDTNDTPLAGVTVSIANTTLSVLTDGSGVFRFNEPVTGDQVLVIDGSTALQAPAPAPRRKFSITRAAISIGLNQNSVLQRPIYLAAIPLDDPSVPTIAAAAGGTVISQDAPGVSLSIPAGAAQFPSGLAADKIYMAKVDAKVSTLPPLDFASPKSVIALEPSGLTFSQPVQLTLPNDNELPAGVDLMIMSMNSRKGIWEIDGVARVSSDGRTVVTKEGMGITHFSTIYAAPPGPSVFPIGSQDVPGADTFNGALSTSVNLPSYKSLGKDISPSVLYKSSWSKPTTVLSNLFDIPRNEISLDRETGDVFFTRKRGCFLFFCGDVDVYLNVSQQGRAWYEPDFITSQFFTAGITGPVMKFTGMPNRAKISYSSDLIDPASGKYLETGLYPYYSHWEVHLKQIVIGSRTVTVKLSEGDPKIEQVSLDETRRIEQAFPSDLGGPLFVQNEMNSSVGKGWRIGGTQRIFNIDSDRVMIEEADGGVSSYAVSNTISTLFDGKDSHIRFDQGADLTQWPVASVTLEDGIGKVDLSSQNSTVSRYNTHRTYSGRIEGNAFIGDGWTFFDSNPEDADPYTGIWRSHAGCFMGQYPYNLPRNVSHILSTPNGDVLALDSRMSYFYKAIPGGSESVLSGRFGNAPTFFWTSFSGPSGLGVVYSYCQGTLGVSCDVVNSRLFPGDAAIPNSSQDALIMPSEDPLTAACGPIPQSVGTIPNPGFSGDGSLDTLLNSPQWMTAGPDNSVVIADTGNNRIRKVDLATNTITTIAGNGQYFGFDVGENVPALQASVSHPRSAVYDSSGNLYIATESGVIRKVDVTGRMTTFAGSQNGLLVDRTAAKNISLLKPYGMVVDNQNGLLYVADTGHHRIVRIDFQTRTAQAVAGSGAASDSIDGQAALNAGLSSPTILGLDDGKNLIVVDSGNKKIKRITFQNSSTGILAFSSLSTLKKGARINPDGSLVPHLQRFADGTWARNYRNGTRDFFDVDGRQTATLDRAGRQTTYNYDGGRRLQSIVDPAGRVTSYAYSGTQLASITDPTGRATRFQIDPATNQLRSILFPDGSTKSYSYDSAGLMLSVTNEAGMTTNYTYNQWNRLETTITAMGRTLAMSDSASKTVGNANIDGNSSIMQPVGTETGGVLDTLFDAKGNPTTVIKDTRGYVASVADATQRETKIVRNLAGQPTELTRPDGSKVTYVYDGETEDLLSQTDTSAGITTSQTFDSFGNLLTKTTGRNLTSRTEYDSATGLVLAKTDSLGHRTTYSYSGPLLLLTKVTDFRGKATNYSYDAFGNLASVSDPLGNVTTYTRDGAGRAIASTNANQQTTQMAFDLMNRITKVTTPMGRVTQYNYLATGQLSKITDAAGNQATFEFDADGHMVKKTDALGLSSQYAYDENGNLIQEQDPNGNIKHYTFDVNNRLIQKSLPDNLIEIAYDDRGNIARARNQESEVNHSYDVIGRLTRADSRGLGSYSDLPNFSVAYEYDSDSNRTRMTDSLGGASSYAYDGGDRLTQITNHKGEIFQFDFSQEGSGQLTFYRPGSSTTGRVNDAGQISSLVHMAGGTEISSFIYEMDSIGNRTKITTQAGNRTIAYDADNQLRAASNPEAASSYSSEAFNYDEIYNRVANQDGNSQYDPKKQRLIEDYKYFYFYDNNGNLTSKQAKGLTGEVTNFSYSSENQLLSFKVYVPGSSSPVKEVSYVYDATGRRIQKKVIDHAAELDPVKSFTRRFAYDGQDILIEFDGGNQILARYTHSTVSTDSVLAADISSVGASQALAQASGSYFYLKDGLGSVIDVVDSSGNRLQHYVYSAFGELLGIKGAVAADITSSPVLRTSYGFAGRELDSESGLYYNRARYYDPGVGRFLQKDPQPGKLGLPITVTNAYIYAGNDPFNLSDPSGESFLGVLAGIILAVVAIAVVAIAATVIPMITAATGDIIGGFIGSTLLGGGTTGAIAGGITGSIAGAAVGGAIGGLMGGLAGASAFGSVHLIGGGEFGGDLADAFKGGAHVGTIIGGLAGSIAGGYYGGGAGAKAGGNIPGIARATGQIINGAGISGGDCAAAWWLLLIPLFIDGDTKPSEPIPAPVPDKLDPGYQKGTQLACR